MNNLKKVYKHLNKKNLSTQKVELAMDFNSILKEVKNDLSKIEKQASQLNKLASSFAKAKNPDLSGVPQNRRKKIQTFFKEFSKKANDLGIDVKSTVFYKEYLDALGTVGKMERGLDDIKASKKLVR
jgi:t-SNARE complex subunit (syntaxin)|tara:strand:+ start:1012 stop:1392 length:381 start_codon:yes stop_codon:yes gene_type:complete